MSDLTIYQALRAGGLSPAGACAMMGNMYCESGCISYRVQGDQKQPFDYSKQYTAQVDAGNINRHEFIYDAPGGGGYGLCQWTSHDRKEHLYDFAKSRGVSIGDEVMQCDFCIWELMTYYVGLYRDLCVTTDLADATKRICAEFERPAVNNYAERINAAQRFYNEFADVDVNAGFGEDSCPIENPEPEPEEETCAVHVRVLHKGDLGRDVFLLQAGLFDMGYDCGIPDGDFGVNTDGAVKQLQRANDVDATGIADWFVWQTVLQAR